MQIENSEFGFIGSTEKEFQTESVQLGNRNVTLSQRAKYQLSTAKRKNEYAYG